jgi:hypothetical protein
MKNFLALSFTLAALTATSAFAVAQTGSSAHPTVAATATQSVVVQTPSTTKKDSAIVLPRTGLQGDIYVAENRPEFGSRYQRY